MSELMSATDIEVVKAEHTSDDGFCAVCRVWTNDGCLPRRLANTALSLLGDQPAPEQPTHHTNDCDLLIRHRACSCGYAEVTYARTADL